MTIHDPRLLRLQAITDGRVAAAHGHSLQGVVRELLAAGVRLVQLRDKEADGRRLYEQACQLLALTRPVGALLVIDDRVDVALAAGADGVHVGQDDLPAAEVRRLAGPGLLLGVSCATPEEATRAERDGADYLGVGSVFPTGSKADAGEPIGLPGLQRVVVATRLPVVAIGGITAENAASVMAVGAAGIAVVSALMGASDPLAAARTLMRVTAAEGERSGRR